MAMVPAASRQSARKRIGPKDHGRLMTLDEFEAGDYEEGFKYELIDGRLYVSPAPDPSDDRIETWLLFKMHYYVLEHPGVINYVSNRARVFVPGRRRATNPEPDLTGFRNYPLDVPFRQVRWQDLTPVLVVEILAGEGEEKDLGRNVDLYLQVPSIREYWVIDAWQDPDRPTMVVHRRHGGRWRVIQVAYGETYRTRLLPGFELVLDPRR